MGDALDYEIGMGLRILRAIAGTGNKQHAAVRTLAFNSNGFDAERIGPLTTKPATERH